MRIKIKLSEGEKDIEVSPKKKDRNNYLDKIEEMKKSIDSDDSGGISETRGFMDYEDKLAVDCSSITQEEFDSLDLEEQAKIVKAVRGIIFPQAGGDPANFF